MFCYKCGKYNSDEANFCVGCGRQLKEVVSESDIPLNAENEEKRNRLSGDEGEGIDCLENAERTVEELAGNISDKTDTNKEIVGLTKKKKDFIVPQEKDFFYRPGEIAYASCISINGDSYHFYCIDKLSHFYWKKEIVDYVNPDLKVGDYLWVSLNELLDSRKYIYKAYYNKTERHSVGNEIRSFSRYHNCGDCLYAPIVEVSEDYFSVGIGQAASVRVYFASLPSYIDSSKIRKNTIRKFKIISLSNDRRVTIKLAFDEKQFEQDEKRWDELPRSIQDRSQVRIYPKMLEVIKEDDFLCRELFGQEEKTIGALSDILQKKYIIEYERRKINIQIRNKCMYMDFDLGIRDEKGVPQSACFKKREGDTWVLCMIGFASAECVFEKYVYVPSWKQLLNELAEMALGDEDWDYKGSGKEDKYILKQYLLFDFYKSWLDDLIVEENGEAIFNTGLVDSSYDDIYCYLKKNTCKEDFYKRAWEFGYFACRAKGSCGKKVNEKFAKFPSAPTYVDVNRISDLYFNPEKELFCDYEHIIGDNLKRLPLEFIKSKLSYDSNILACIEMYEKTKKNSDLEKIIAIVNRKDDQGARLRRDLQNGLKDAVETARKYCKWNYKTAIPIYYPRNNSISLLLPLKLRTDYNSQADVALVAECLSNGNYQGQTILTLAMAYQDARQICRPNSEWLTINNIVKSDDELEEDEMDAIEETF